MTLVTSYHKVVFRIFASKKLIASQFCVLNPYPANIFVQKMSSAYEVCCINSNALKTIKEANRMNQDQTAPEQSDLGSSLCQVH